MKRISLPYLIAALGIGLLAPRKLSAMELTSTKKASIQTIELKSFTPELNTFVSIDSHSLHEASTNGLIDIVKAHLEAGKKINARDENGNTPLHLAASNGQLECLKALLEAGANINAQKKNSLTPLHYAAHKGHLECLKALVAAGANINAQNQSRETSLHYAAAWGHPECLKVLVVVGANREAQGKNGFTPLHLAAYHGQLECLKALLEAGANINAQDKNERTPLHLAAIKGKSDCVTILIEKELQKTSLQVSLLFADSEKFVGQFPVQMSKTLGKLVQKSDSESDPVRLLNITHRTWNFIIKRINSLFALTKLNMVGPQILSDKIKEEIIEEYSSLNKDDIAAICSAAKYLRITLLIPIIHQAYARKLVAGLNQNITDDLPSGSRYMIYAYILDELRK